MCVCVSAQVCDQVKVCVGVCVCVCVSVCLFNPVVGTAALKPRPHARQRSESLQHTAEWQCRSGLEGERERLRET